MFYFTYFFVVLLHKWYVLIAGLKVGGIPLYRLLIHDWTKFTKSEFGPYARKHYGGYYPKSIFEAPVGYTDKLRSEVEQEYIVALNSHYKHNLHHWNHWVKDGVAQEMPEVYVREMLADFFAAGRTYQKSWNITAWLQNNIFKMNLHPNTRTLLYGLLREFGYVVYRERVIDL